MNTFVILSEILTVYSMLFYANSDETTGNLKVSSGKSDISTTTSNILTTKSNTFTTKSKISTTMENITTLMPEEIKRKMKARRCIDFINRWTLVLASDSRWEFISEAYCSQTALKQDCNNYFFAMKNVTFPKVVGLLHTPAICQIANTEELCWKPYETNNTEELKKYNKTGITELGSTDLKGFKKKEELCKHMVNGLRQDINLLAEFKDDVNTLGFCHPDFNTTLDICLCTKMMGAVALIFKNDLLKLVNEEETKYCSDAIIIQVDMFLVGVTISISILQYLFCNIDPGCKLQYYFFL